MHRLVGLYKLYIFEMIPRERRTLNKAEWWKNVQLGKQIPYSFAWGFQVTIDVVMLGVMVIVGVITHAPGITIVGMELLLIGTYALLLLARIGKQFLTVVGAYLIIIGLGSMLNLVFPGMWGSIVFYTLSAIMLYRFPPGWSLPLTIVCVLALIITEGALGLLPVQYPGNPETLALNLAVIGGICWFGWSRRTQYLLVVRLDETQEQLREQMVHSEELATARERTRIARDIHDVLSHSLAVLSIQVQAARHLVTRDPERLTKKLDDMALLIRESITESRHVVGLLREKPATPFEDNLGASLRSIANTFNERTGIRCLIEENGTPHKVGLQQREALQLALREMLTNAHRHGAAHTVWITWRWRKASIILEVRDDGRGASLEPTDVLAKEMSQEVDGHHGLQGIRERVAALSGTVEAGLAETGGFTVTLKLPFEQFNEISAQKI